LNIVEISEVKYFGLPNDLLFKIVFGNLATDLEAAEKKASKKLL